MSNNPTSYFQIIRKMSVAFAGLFKNITIIRSNPDLTAEKIEDQRFIVPIEYADKEKYTKRLLGDPDLQKKIQIILPRLSYEFLGLEYDSSRKLNTNNKNYAVNPNSAESVLSQYNPVPYNFNYQLTAYARTIEDATQIVEQILPYFTPDFSIKLNLVQEMGIVKIVPILLDRVTPSIESDGPFDSEVRVVMFTFDFTIKAFIFGGIKTENIIQQANVNISSSNNNFISGSCDNLPTKSFIVLNTGSGDYNIGEIVYQGYNLENAIGTAEVSYWNKANSIITLSRINGTIKVGQTIIGTSTLSTYMIDHSYANNETYLNINITA